MPTEEFTAFVEALVARLSGPHPTCNEHSGLTTWVKIGCGLLSTLLIVFSWSTFVVAPEVKSELARQTALFDRRLYAVERDVQDTKSGLARLANQRNLDHANKEKYQ